MDQAIRFQNVVAGELLKDVSFAVAAGSLAAVITSRHEENELQVRLILGLARPDAGSVAVLGEDVGAAPEKVLNALRKRVSAVFPTGGLISNLKVWENLVLPLEYHAVCPPLEVEERGLAALERVGYRGGLMELPGLLSLYERRQVGMARAMLVEPSLIIYDEILAGLRGDEKSAVVAAALAFHREKPGRTSVFITANEEAVKEIPLDSRTFMEGSSMHG